MSTSDIKEEAFEALIEKALVGSTIEEREAQGITSAKESRTNRKDRIRFMTDSLHRLLVVV